MHQIVRFEKIDSTQKEARRLIQEGKSFHGLVILAETQITGVGRFERRWESPQGGLWMTTIYQQKIPHQTIIGFSVKLGLQICEALEEVLPVNLQVKWPNDIYLKNRKVGGILIDALSKDDFVSHLLVGIGINVNNSASHFLNGLSNKTISLKDIINEVLNIDEITNTILSSQFQLYSNSLTNHKTSFVDKWVRRSHTFNKEVIIHSFEERISGIESGISESCELLVKQKDGSMRVVSMGEISKVREKGCE